MKFDLPVLYSKTSPSNRRLVRDQYVKEQGGLCYWCGHPLTSNPPKDITDRPLNMRLFPNGFLKHPVHLQHNHDTDLTEGAVHSLCNGIMWQYYGR